MSICVAACCSVLQRVAACCSVLQRVSVCFIFQIALACELRHITQVMISKYPSFRLWRVGGWQGSEGCGSALNCGAVFRLPWRASWDIYHMSHGWDIYHTRPRDLGHISHESWDMFHTTSHISHEQVGTCNTRGITSWDKYHTNHGTYVTWVVSHTSELGHMYHTSHCWDVYRTRHRELGHISHESNPTWASWDMYHSSHRCWDVLYTRHCELGHVSHESWDMFQTSELGHVSLEASFHTTYEWVMSHIWMCRVTHMNVSCIFCTVMWHTWMRHVTHVNQSCYTYEWDMSRICTSRASFVLSCDTYAWVRWRTWISQIERGVAGSDPSTRGRSPVVLEVLFRSRALSIAEFQSDIVLGYLHYLDFCAV